MAHAQDAEAWERDRQNILDLQNGGHKARVTQKSLVFAILGTNILTRLWLFHLYLVFAPLFADISECAPVHSGWQDSGAARRHRIGLQVGLCIFTYTFMHMHASHKHRRPILIIAKVMMTTMMIFQARAHRGAPRVSRKGARAAHFPHGVPFLLFFVDALLLLSCCCC